MIIEGFAANHNIKLDGKTLSPAHSLKVFNHSPTGFNWGYGGSGPAQLALAILLTTTIEDKAIRLYQDFKWQYVNPLPFNKDFKVEIDVEQWIKEKCEELKL